MRIALPAAAGLLLLSNTADAGFINEFHYDNIGTDANEFVEFVLAPGEMITNFSLELYNGSNGSVYNTITSFSVGAVEEGYQFFVANLPSNGLQNGSPDGFALIDSGSVAVSGGVTQFLSYEGSFTAVGGTADGLTSTDVGVEESNATTTADQSLQLQGVGTDYSDFTWDGPLASTNGVVNAGQSFSTAAVPEPATFLMVGLASLGGLAVRRRKRAA